MIQAFFQEIFACGFFYQICCFFGGVTRLYSGLAEVQHLGYDFEFLWEYVGLAVVAIPFVGGIPVSNLSREASDWKT